MATINDPNVAANIAAVKAASTAPVATDPALVVAISPNGGVSSSGGTVAHDGPASAVNPVLIGGYANAAAPSDVSADLDAVRAWFLRNGSLVMQAAYAGVLAAVNNGTASTGTPRVAIASDNTAVSGLGAGATGSAVIANAIYEGARAATANPTNATGGNLVGLMADKAGRLVTTPGHVRDLIGIQQTAIGAVTTETTIITAGGANVFNDLLGLIVTTVNVAAATLTIRDATAGTTRMILNYPNAAAAPGAPLILCPGFAIPQAAANNNWTAQASASATGLNITAIFAKNL